MIKPIQKLLDLYRLPFQVSQTKDIAKNTLALTAMEKLLSPGIFFPISSPSLEPNSLLQVVNDIIINQKSVVVEVGPGLSTVVLCRLKKMNNLKFSFFAIESNADWLSLIQNQLKTEGLEDMVQLIHAPLEPCPISFKPGYQWYSLPILDQYFSSVSNIDLVLVDGPPAYEPRIQFSRYPAFPYFQKKLKSSYSFYLDDVHRKGETTILEAWSTLGGVASQRLSNTFGVVAKDLPFVPFLL